MRGRTIHRCVLGFIQIADGPRVQSCVYSLRAGFAPAQGLEQISVIFQRCIPEIHQKAALECLTFREKALYLVLLHFPRHRQADEE